MTMKLDHLSEGGHLSHVLLPHHQHKAIELHLGGRKTDNGRCKINPGVQSSSITVNLRLPVITGINNGWGQHKGLKWFSSHLSKVQMEMLKAGWYVCCPNMLWLHKQSPPKWFYNAIKELVFQKKVCPVCRRDQNTNQKLRSFLYNGPLIFSIKIKEVVPLSEHMITLYKFVTRVHTAWCQIYQRGLAMWQWSHGTWWVLYIRSHQSSLTFFSLLSLT